MKYRNAAGGIVLVVVGLIMATIGAQIVDSVVTEANFQGVKGTIAENLTTFMLLGGLALAAFGGFSMYQGQ